MNLHGGLVARYGGGAWRGVFIQGPSGCGKSTLALRLLQAGWRLVADDRALLWASGGRLYGRAPNPLHGLIEARAVGVAPVAALRFAEVVLAIRHGQDFERLPEPERRALAGVNVPSLALDLLHAATPERLTLAWELAVSDARSHRLDSASGGAYQAALRREPAGASAARGQSRQSWA